MDLENTDGLDNSADVAQEPEGAEVNETENNSENVQDAQNSDNSAETSKAEPEQQGKFKTLEDANKSYEELQKKLGSQSNELGELRKQAERVKELEAQINSQKLTEANNNGFETVRAYEDSLEMNKFEADLYRKHINECDYPDEMVNLLNEMGKSASVSKELREAIESQFPLDTIKSIAGEKKIFEGQLEAREQQALYNDLENSARGYLNEVVPKYAKEFENPAFGQLFGEAFRAFGCDLQAETLVNLLHQYVEYANKVNNVQSAIDKENSNATDAIAGVANSGSSKGRTSTNLLNLSDEAAAERLGELI